MEDISDKYSRQSVIVGEDGQKNILSSTIAILGLSDVGCEIAKNVLCAGIKKLILVDAKRISMKQLSTNVSHFHQTR